MSIKPGNHSDSRVPGALQAFLALWSLAMIPGFVGAAPEDAVPYELPSARAESPLMETRRLHPERVFLIDGGNALALDGDFYRAPGDYRRFGAIYRQPRLAPLSAAGPEGAPGSWGFSSRLGNEVGDPYLHELVEPEVENHTPYLSGFFRFPLGAGAGGAFGLEQNDHFSYATVARRSEAGGKPPAELAWFGENIPPYSLLRAMAEGDAAGLRLRGEIDQGWWWNFSPVTGIVYPFEGRRAGLRFSDSRGFDLELSSRAADHPRGLYAFAENEATLGIPLVHTQRARAGISLGVAHRSLRADTLLESWEEWDLPLGIDWRWEPETPQGPGLGLVGQGSWGEDMGLAEQHITYRLHRAPEWQTRMRAYYLFQGPGSSPTGMASGLGEGDMEENRARHRRGLTLALAYTRKIGVSDLSLEAKEAREWGLPLVSENSRPGPDQPSPHVLGSRGLALACSGSLVSGIDYSAKAGLRRFFGAGNSGMEFVPAPYWFGLRLKKEFTTDLRVEASADFLGPKRVRGWGADLIIPPHWENHLFLEQTFLEGRLKFHYGALHAFGADLREHPRGNPLRFRILAGADAAF